MARRAAIFMVAMALLGLGPAGAQEPEYATRPAAAQTGHAPGLKATELSPRTRSFQLVFAKGDEVQAGLAEFAARNHLTNAHFTAIGAFDHAVIGWFDSDKRAYKILRLNEEMEVTSFTGNITRGQSGNLTVHTHCVVAFLRNGEIHAGHLLEGHVSLTMQLYLDDAEPLAANGQ
jgi:predicted DNA-binding protein with PD1-like motif